MRPPSAPSATAKVTVDDGSDGCNAAAAYTSYECARWRPLPVCVHPPPPYDVAGRGPCAATGRAGRPRRGMRLRRRMAGGSALTLCALPVSGTCFYSLTVGRVWRSVRSPSQPSPCRARFCHRSSCAVARGSSPPASRTAPLRGPARARVWLAFAAAGGVRHGPSGSPPFLPARSPPPSPRVVADPRRRPLRLRPLRVADASSDGGAVCDGARDTHARELCVADSCLLSPCARLAAVRPFVGRFRARPPRHPVGGHRRVGRGETRRRSRPAARSGHRRPDFWSTASFLVAPARPATPCSMPQLPTVIAPISLAACTICSFARSPQGRPGLSGSASGGRGAHQARGHAKG